MPLQAALWFSHPCASKSLRSADCRCYSAQKLSSKCLPFKLSFVLLSIRGGSISSWPTPILKIFRYGSIHLNILGNQQPFTGNLFTPLLGSVSTKPLKPWHRGQWRPCISGVTTTGASGNQPEPQQYGNNQPRVWAS